jgi:DHA1 family tetracycline resistance protein-like MFS transporter
VQGIATMVGPALFAGSFAWSIRDGAGWHLPGAAWVLAGLLLVGSAAIAAHATRARGVG